MWLKAITLALADSGKFVGFVLFCCAALFWAAFSYMLLFVHWGGYITGEPMTPIFFGNENLPLQTSVLEFTLFVLANAFWLGLFAWLFVRQTLNRRKILLHKT